MPFFNKIVWKAENWRRPTNPKFTYALQAKIKRDKNEKSTSDWYSVGFLMRHVIEFCVMSVWLWNRIDLKLC